jgi:hypothetical protein
MTFAMVSLRTGSGDGSKPTSWTLAGIGLPSWSVTRTSSVPLGRQLASTVATAPAAIVHRLRLGCRERPAVPVDPHVVGPRRQRAREAAGAVGAEVRHHARQRPDWSSTAHVGVLGRLARFVHRAFQRSRDDALNRVASRGRRRRRCPRPP